MSQKIFSHAPRGFPDLESETIRCLEKITSTVSQTFELCGFEPLQQPIVDYSASLGKFLPDQERPNEGVFSFQDDDQQWLSLRYDLTAPMARFVAENYERLPKPYRSYRSGWVFRNEKPGPGRFRQFMQYDADTVGTSDVAADAEMIMIMADIIENLGFHRGEYVIKINHRKLLDGLLESIGIKKTSETKTQRLTILRALDKLDKIALDGVISLLGKGRWDGSHEGQGDFTKGADLNAQQIDKIIAYLSEKAEMSEFSYSFQKNLDHNQKSQEALQDLERIQNLVRAGGYHSERIMIDTSVVRGLEYYTGPVYEAELLTKIPNDEGQMVRCGAISGGGRYDDLLSLFRKESLPSTGFSIGVSRLMTALRQTGKLEIPEVMGPVIVLAMGKDISSTARQQKFVSDLRKAGIRAELYLGDASMKAQMRYADRRKSPCVVIQGTHEAQRNEIQVKDLVKGLCLSDKIQDNQEWREKNPAQITIPETELIKTVRHILAEQARKTL